MKTDIAKAGATAVGIVFLVVEFILVFLAAS